MKAMVPAAALIAASLSANTRRAYGHAWESWLDWLGDAPASDATLSAYLAALHEADNAPATCALHAAALNFGHRRGHPRPRKRKGHHVGPGRAAPRHLRPHFCAPAAMNHCPGKRGHAAPSCYRGPVEEEVSPVRREQITALARMHDL